MCESSPTRTFSRSQPLSPSRFTNRFFAEYVYLNQLILGILTAWMNIEKKNSSRNYLLLNWNCVKKIAP